MVSALDSDRAVWVRALTGVVVLCSWARHFTLTVPLSIHPGVNAGTRELSGQPDKNAGGLPAID